FRATAYWLNDEKIWQLPVEICSSPWGPNQKHTTIGKVIERIRGTEILKVDGGVRLHVKLTGREETYAGLSFNLRLLETCLRLHTLGASAFNAQFCYYDSDSQTDRMSSRYSFFVVSDNRIVVEELSFLEHPGSGFDPKVFESKDYGRMWFSDNYWDEARVRSWYRKFYEQTEIGQLMVLRPDKPQLYYYPEGRRSLQMQLHKIQSLLIGLLVIGVILVFLLWR